MVVDESLCPADRVNLARSGLIYVAYEFFTSVDLGEKWFINGLVIKQPFDKTVIEMKGYGSIWPFQEMA